ncbi:hypothetical protein HYPSUDRAFT_48976 [Hypholoma sublateritium FD-334 SS-4]|uniref:BTB domain-containing protein n=1 Tax=Hypholoma sublateritium (strain FD-334 SS-4) TaxID=945553 RepID=A0A0D2KJ42_HYPSF|nr:hypothetical protein HYPSUDRAFT_48976 [Hypholoma sublateritium FD-334 SS-4]
MSSRTATGAKRKTKNERELKTSAPHAPKARKICGQHDTHWAADGRNLRLQIGDTRFKLLKSRLVAESTWFAARIAQRGGTALRRGVRASVRLAVCWRLSGTWTGAICSTWT